jgi:hypothetical protein
MYRVMAEPIAAEPIAVENLLAVAGRLSEVNFLPRNPHFRTICLKDYPRLSRFCIYPNYAFQSSWVLLMASNRASLQSLLPVFT